MNFNETTKNLVFCTESYSWWCPGLLTEKTHGPPTPESWLCLSWPEASLAHLTSLLDHIASLAEQTSHLICKFCFYLWLLCFGNQILHYHLVLSHNKVFSHFQVYGCTCSPIHPAFNFLHQTCQYYTCFCLKDTMLCKYYGFVVVVCRRANKNRDQVKHRLIGLCLLELSHTIFLCYGGAFLTKLPSAPNPFPSKLSVIVQS